MSYPKLRLVAPGVDIEVNMGDGPATPTAGFSAAEVVDRVGQRAATAIEGLQPFQQDVPILIDGFTEDESVQKRLDTVLSLGGRVFTAWGPIFLPGRKFIFGDEPEFGEMLRGTEHPFDPEALTRCRLTLKLMEYVPADAVGKPKHSSPLGDPARTGGTAFPGSTYIVKAGDTLTKIAASLYGDAHLWKKIGELNKISDPNKKLKVGTVLRLPASYPHK